MTYSLLIGSNLIADITNPQPHEMDLEFIDRRLTRIVRFSDHPKALTVAQHQSLVEALVKPHARSEDDLTWARHHDDAEAITGDLVGPIKNFLSERNGRFLQLETGFANAILTARGQLAGWVRTQRFYMDTSLFVHHYDRIAETLEWEFIMGLGSAPWHRAYSPEDYTVFSEWLEEHVWDLYKIGPLRGVTP